MVLENKYFKEYRVAKFSTPTSPRLTSPRRTLLVAALSLTLGISWHLINMTRTMCTEFVQVHK